MARLYGWGVKSERVVSDVPHGHWQTTTFVGALRTSGMTAPMVIDGAMNGDLFLAYVRQLLVPTLHRGDIVVMDNLSSHKKPGVREAIEQVGATLAYLPPYSPDLATHWTLQSNWRSPNSRLSFESSANVPENPSGTASANSSMNSHPPNAATISATADTLQTNSENALEVSDEFFT